jgi:hypothetical protein
MVERVRAGRAPDKQDTAARCRMDEVAAPVGSPGKLGVDGSQVEALHGAGDLAAIRAYCETDVLDTDLVYLHWACLTGLPRKGSPPPSTSWPLTSRPTATAVPTSPSSSPPGVPRPPPRGSAIGRRPQRPRGGIHVAPHYIGTGQSPGYAHPRSSRLALLPRR